MLVYSIYITFFFCFNAIFIYHMHVFLSNFVCQFQKVNTGRFRHRRKSSVEINSDIFLNTLNVEDVNSSAIQDVINSPSTAQRLHDSSQIEQQVREYWAATQIQTAFRGFLVLYLFYYYGFVFFAFAYYHFYDLMITFRLGGL